jgi:hypothetical protein
MAEGNNYSLSDIASLMQNKDGFLEGNGIIILILFFLIFGGGGFGGAWGNNGMQGSLTRAELNDGFNNQTVVRKLDGISSGLCDGFYAQNTTMLNGFNHLSNEIAGNRFAAQQCCCETNRNIDAVRYEAAKNTCDITSNATSNTQKILDKLCEMEGHAKDQRIADLTSSLQTANFQLSQQAQNATLIREIRPTPIPAYVTGSPYQTYGYPYESRAPWMGCGY